MGTRKYRMDRGRIFVETSFKEQALAQSVMGARWSSKERSWHFAETPATWDALCAAFPEIAVDPQNNCEMLGASQVAWQSEIRKAARARRSCGLRDGRRQLPFYKSLTTPWAHQVIGTHFAVEMDACLLHCWMGTGKTKMVLDALMHESAESVLVLCPKSVIQVWVDEAGTHAGKAWTLIPLQKGSVAKRSDQMRTALARSTPVLVIVNYDAARVPAMRKALCAHTWDALVMDESHRIKGPGSKTSRTAAAIPATKRVALTGTPMPHSPLDIFAQFRALDSGIFGTSFSRFRARYAIMGGFEGKQVTGWQNEAELREKISLLTYQVPRDVLDLPPLTKSSRYCELGPEARKAYNSMKRDLIAEVNDGIVTASNALSKLLRLQQFASGFAVDETGSPSHLSGHKRTLLQEVLEGTEERVVVFCRFRHDLDVVREVSGQLKLTVGELSGRVNDYTKWKDSDELTVFAVQIQAGGVGVNLSAASLGVFFTLGYSLGDYEQCIARLHRPGQENPVRIVHLLTRDTVDLHVMRALRTREKVIESVLGGLMG